MELADRIVNGEISVNSYNIIIPTTIIILLLQNGLALVRPPGHHALPNQAM